MFNEDHEATPWLFLIAGIVAIVFLISAFCSAARASEACAYDSQEARITELLAEEPSRKFLILVGDSLATFAANMKTYFDVTIIADKVYIVMAKMDGSANQQGAYVFTIKDHCVTYRASPPASLVSRLMEPIQ